MYRTHAFAMCTLVLRDGFEAFRAFSVHKFRCPCQDKKESK